jgi:hypothetical protein
MRPMYRSMLGAALLAVAGPLAVASPASAAEPLTASITFCDSGLRQFICLGNSAGGEGVRTQTWTPRASGSCSANRFFTVTLTATDSTGATASDSERVWCSSNQWP